MAATDALQAKNAAPDLSNVFDDVKDKVSGGAQTAKDQASQAQGKVGPFGTVSRNAMTCLHFCHIAGFSTHGVFQSWRRC